MLPIRGAVLIISTILHIASAQAIRLVKVNQLHAFASQETKKQIEHHAFRHQAAGLSCEFGLHSDNRLTVSKQTMYVFQREYATHREGSA